MGYGGVGVLDRLRWGWSSRLAVVGLRVLARLRWGLSSRQAMVVVLVERALHWGWTGDLARLRLVGTIQMRQRCDSLTGSVQTGGR